MIHSDSITNEEKFMTWLSSKVSAAQLSELYVIYKEIDNYCKRVKILKQPLFETLNYSVARKVQKAIESDKAFRIFHRKQISKYIRAVSHYCQYLKEEGQAEAPANTHQGSTDSINNHPDGKDIPASASIPSDTTAHDDAGAVENATASLSDRIKKVLKEECELSPYGTTVTFIISKVVGANKSDVKKILDDAPWATFAFGAWKYQEPITESTPSTPVSDKVNALPSSADISSDVLTIDFENIPPLVYTKPMSLSYFGEATNDLNSWPGLYVKFFSLLYEDYSHLLKVGASFTVNGDGCVELGDASMVNTMVSPKPFDTHDCGRLFLETNLSEFNLVGKMKFLLDLCSVDYENVVITYENEGNKSSSPDSIAGESFSEGAEKRDVWADKDTFIRWLKEDQGLAESTCRNYISAICQAERFAKEHGLSSIRLYSNNYDEAKATEEALFANPVFVRLNADKHNMFRAAIALLFAFYSDKPKILDKESQLSKDQDDGIERYKSAPVNEIDTFLSGDEFVPLRRVLTNQHITTIDELKSIKLWPFMNRHNVYSIGMRQVILSKVNSLLYPAAEIDDARAYVLRVGDSVYKGLSPADAFRQYCDDMLTRYPLQIRLLVGMRTQNGAVPIYKGGSGPQSLNLTGLPAFVRSDLSPKDVISYTNWIHERCGEKPLPVTIFEPKDAEQIVQTSADGTSGDNHSAPVPLREQGQSKQDPTQRRISPLVKQIEEIVLAADMQGVSYDDARDALKTTMVATRNAVADSEHIVNLKGRLIHEDAFVDWEDGADQLEAIIDKLMQKNRGYISAAQLYEYAKVEMNMFLTDNDLNDERSVFDIATHLFEKKGYHDKHYSFYGKMHISRKDHLVTSNLDIFRNFAADQGGIFSFDALVDYLHSIGIASGNLRMQMRIPDEPIFFYYENGILIYADNMNIDDAWISTVKKELAILLTDVGGHIVLRAVPDMWLEQLPSLPTGKHWTPLLLQSVLRCYSNDLGAKTIQALSGQSLDTLHTMLVANDSPIQTFGDVVVSYLVENDIDKRSFEAETLRLLLVDAGIIQGNELIWNMPKALSNDERFAWNASGDHVIVEV